MNIFRICCNRRQIYFIFAFTFVLLIGVYTICSAGYGNGVSQLSENSCEKLERNNNASLTSENDVEALKKCRHSSVWIKSSKKKNKHLKHVVNAFKAFNYEILDLQDEEIPTSEWNIIWSHQYPFKELKSHFRTLKTTHCVNHFPGTGFITSKVSLALSGIPSIPKAFRIPEEKSHLLKFAKENPGIMFVQKSNHHRGIKIERVEALNFEKEISFVQQFIHNPLLVDGYKFDIGVYTVVTSVNPLRVYTFEDVLFRFCTEKYHPFSANDSRKYVVGENYRPTWEVPSLHHYYNKQKLGMKGSFDTWLQKQNKNPTIVWEGVQESIRSVFYSNEDSIISNSKAYPSHLKFFEVMRFDFIIDEDLNVYLMEANMSPNLSSAHFQENRLIYEQVVFNLLSLVGLPYNLCSPFVSREEEEMRCSRKDVAVFPEHCSAYCEESSDCDKVDCQLCHPCLNEEHFQMLRMAFLEHTWRGSYRRVIPKPLKEYEANTPTDSERLSPKNTLMSEWFRGKCLLDVAFCL